MHIPTTPLPSPIYTCTTMGLVGFFYYWKINFDVFLVIATSFTCKMRLSLMHVLKFSDLWPGKKRFGFCYSVFQVPAWKFYRWRAKKLMRLLGTYVLWARRGLYCVTPGFCSLIWKTTAQFSRSLRQARGT